LIDIYAPAPSALDTIQRAMNQRIAVKTNPLMTVPQSESKGFFTARPPRSRCLAVHVALSSEVSFRSNAGQTHQAADDLGLAPATPGYPQKL